MGKGVSRQKIGQALPSRRAYVRPEAGDDWQTLAARVLPDEPTEQAVESLQSWNFHVLMRAGGSAKSSGTGKQILPSDIIFTAPPEPTRA